jgi:hypothetical protein
MSDPVAARLSKFTPDASGLDRDALLYAAGRASVRPNRLWMALAGALASSQLLTLAFLWFQATGPVIVPTPAPSPIVAPRSVTADQPSPSLAPDASSYWPLRDKAIDVEGDLPAPRSVELLAPSEPPLHAFAKPPAALLQ